MARRRPVWVCAMIWRNSCPKISSSFQDHPSGLMDYYDRTPAIHPYLEGSGTFSTGVGEMLLQSWPVTRGRDAAYHPRLSGAALAWDARFKLLAMGGFEVECVAEKGMPRVVGITSTHGGTAQVANPFGKETVVTDGRPHRPEKRRRHPEFSDRSGPRLQARGERRHSAGAGTAAAGGQRSSEGIEAGQPALDRSAEEGRLEASRRSECPATSRSCGHDRPAGPSRDRAGPFLHAAEDRRRVERRMLEVGAFAGALFQAGNENRRRRADRCPRRLRQGRISISASPAGNRTWTDVIAKYEASPPNRDESIFTDDSVEIIPQAECRIPIGIWR